MRTIRARLSQGLFLFRFDYNINEEFIVDSKFFMSVIPNEYTIPNHVSFVYKGSLLKHVEIKFKDEPETHVDTSEIYKWESMAERSSLIDISDKTVEKLKVKFTALETSTHYCVFRESSDNTAIFRKYIDITANESISLPTGYLIIVEDFENTTINGQSFTTPVCNLKISNGTIVSSTNTRAVCIKIDPNAPDI